MNITAITIDTLLKLDDTAAFAEPVYQPATGKFTTPIGPMPVPDVREPDFIDSTTSTAVWIGADATVEMSVDKLAGLDLLVHQSGFHSRSGRMPSDYDVTVTVSPAYRHPAGGSPAYQAWRAVTDTLEG